MKKQENEKRGAAARSRRTRLGGYSMILIVVAIAVAIVVNLVVGTIPSTLTKYDLSGKKLYTISEQTESIVKAVNQEITLYQIAETGQEDSVIQELLERYAAMNGNISVKQVDPIVFPYFTEAYTSDRLKDNSVIVAGENRSRVIGYDDIYVYTYDYDMYYSQGAGSNYYTVDFAGESQLTSAIDFVTSSTLPVVYVLAGHGETQISDAMDKAISNANLSPKYLNLMSEDGIPEDAGCVFLYGPTADLTGAEVDMLRDYLEGGGNLFLITQYSDVPMPNLEGLMEYYGMEAVDGIVVEGDSNYCLRGYYHYLLPTLQSHIITDPLINGSYRALMPAAQGLKALDSYRSTLTVQSLMDTSDSAYSKLAGYGMTTMEKEAGDLDGPFSIGMVAAETMAGAESHVVWYPTTQFLLEDVDESSSGGNFSLFMNTLNWMCEHEGSVSILPKNLGSNFLSMNAAQSNTLSILFSIVIPVVIFVLGFWVWLRRRKK